MRPCAFLVIVMACTQVASRAAAARMVTPDDQINVKFNSDAEQEQTTTINVQQALRVTLEFPGATGSSWRLDPFPSFTLLGDQESPSAGAPGGFRTHTYRLKPTGAAFAFTAPGRTSLSRRLSRREGMAMGQLFETIRQLVAEEKYVVGQHASERLEERGIMEWQVVAGLEDGELIAERADAIPNAAVEVRESLPDGTEFKAVWSHLPQSGVAKLVTVHFFDRG